MNKFKRLYLSLCCLLTFCVGFLSIDSLTVHAYSDNDNFYHIVAPNSYISFYKNNMDWSNRQTYMTNIEGNVHNFTNPIVEDIYAMSWESNESFAYVYDFPYNPEVYDYYFLGTLSAYNHHSNKENSTFKPTYIEMYGRDYSTNTNEYYPLSGVGFYDLDSTYYSGFGWYAKVDFESRDNIGLSYINFMNDKDGLGNKPANLKLEMGILVVEKSSSQQAALNQILNQLKQMETSLAENIQNSTNAISSAVGNSAEKITAGIEDAKEELMQKLEEQYEMEEEEDFGVGEIKQQVEEKLGVLNFTADTLSNFLDLFNSSTVGDSKITFPGWSIEVSGETYTVWNNIEFDFAFLEENFGILVNACRTVTVLCVWLAVLSYLGKAKDQIILNRG